MVSKYTNTQADILYTAQEQLLLVGVGAGNGRCRMGGRRRGGGGWGWYDMSVVVGKKAVKSPATNKYSKPAFVLD